MMNRSRENFLGGAENTAVWGWVVVGEGTVTCGITIEAAANIQ